MAFPPPLVTFLLIALGLPSAAAGQPKTDPVAFVNANVIPMDRQRVLAGYTVLVEQGVVREVGPSQTVRVPPGVTIVEARDKYVMPGLIDVHVHLAGTPEERLAILKLFVAQGVTTVLNMRGSPEHLTLRADVAAGRVPGPTIFTVGPYVNEPFVTSPDEVERAVVEQKRAGYDFVKMHGDLTRQAYARLGAASRREGIRVVGHAPRTLGIDALFEERQYAVAHAEEFIYDRQHSSRDPEQVEPEIPGLARRMAGAGIWLMPNLTAFRNIAEQVGNLDAMLARPEMQDLPRTVREGWGPRTNPYTLRMAPERYPHIMALHALLQRITRGFHAAGVRLLLGTDAMNTGTVPGHSAHDELAELVSAGLTPYEALRTATFDAAAFLGPGYEAGVVAEGAKADLLLLDGNPLENIANTRRIAGVMLRGRWLPVSHDSTQLRVVRRAALQSSLESFRVQSRFPGAVLGAWFADGSTEVVTTGTADRNNGLPMPATAILHAGSIGKTLFAAWVLQLVGERRLALDDHVSRYLGAEPWYASLPNSRDITVRMLLDHTAGIPEFGGDFMTALIEQPGRVRQPLEAVKSVTGAEPVAPAGTKFAYSDVNYQLLQLLAERVTGHTATQEIGRRILDPHELTTIVAADRKVIPGLVQGYAGEGFFLGFDAVMAGGSLLLDPTFEGGGGGYVGNAGDLARWMALFAEGHAFERELLAEVRKGVPAGQLDVGANARSGLGVEIVDTPLGTAYGHGGFFPGYLSLALWYPDAGVSLAIQVNSSANGALARPLPDVLLETANALRARRQR